MNINVQNFIDKVKGKQIKWSNWLRNSSNLIPDGSWCIRNGEPYFTGRNARGETVEYTVDNGFDVDMYGYRWEFAESDSVEELNTPTFKTVSRCYCDMRTVIMVDGCTCGHIEKERENI